MVVQLRFTDDPVDYIDMHNMPKTGDEWVIVNKIGRAIEKQEKCLLKFTTTLV